MSEPWSPETVAVNEAGSASPCFLEASSALTVAAAGVIDQPKTWFVIEPSDHV